MPLTLQNTTLNLSTVDQLKAVYEYVVAELSLVDPPDPFTNGLLRQSDQDIAKLIHEVISANLVSVGCSTLPSFSIPDYDNDALVKVLIDQLNYSIAACNLGGDGGESTSLLLIPTGAIESVDGEFQRFVYDGTNTFDFELGGRSYQIPIWYADLPLANRQSEYQISLKMPDLVEFGSARLYLVDADFDLDVFLSPSSLNHLLLELRPEDGSTQLTVNAFGNSEFSSTIGFTQPAAGSVISLTLNTTEINYAWDGGSGTLPIPDGFFSNPPNVVVFSSGDSASHIADLSVRVADPSSSFIG